MYLLIQRFSFKEFIFQQLVNTLLGLTGKLLFFFSSNLPNLLYCFLLLLNKSSIMKRGDYWNVLYALLYDRKF